MIYDKETALEKAGALIPHRDYDGQVEDVAAALLEAQAEALTNVTSDQWGAIKRVDGVECSPMVLAARLRAIAAEIRGE